MERDMSKKMLEDVIWRHFEVQLAVHGAAPRRWLSKLAKVYMMWIIVVHHVFTANRQLSHLQFSVEAGGAAFDAVEIQLS